MLKHGRFGQFIACSGYPECKTTMPVVKKLGIACPKCGKELVERKSRRGKIFYGCIGYPECDQVTWDRPSKEPCPQCGSLMTEKRKKDALVQTCTKEGCGFMRIVPDETKKEDNEEKTV